MSVDTETRARRKLIAAARRARRHLPAALPPVFFLTDPARTPDPAAIAARLPRGWGVIYRHFGAPERAAVAARLARLCRARGLVFLVAADPQLAQATSADGVHWPFRARGQARRWAKRFGLQTASAHSARELRAAATLPVQAILLSAVFPSVSPSAGRAVGALRFRLLARRSARAMFALGGVSAMNAGAIAGHGGLAAIDGLKALTLKAPAC